VRVSDPVDPDWVISERARIADRRDEAADERESELDERTRVVAAAIEAADRRDVAASGRDRAARARDDAATFRDLVADHHDATGQIHAATADRVAAALDRQAASANRHFAAIDRDDAAGDRALLHRRKARRLDEWVVLVAFDDGEFRYYKSLAVAGPDDFTKTLSEARRCDSDSAAWQLARQLNARYPRIRAIRVERNTGPHPA
jgi:hypothetical protein